MSFEEMQKYITAYYGIDTMEDLDVFGDCCQVEELKLELLETLIHLFELRCRYQNNTRLWGKAE
jgi:hypothetical protein